jgi:hypothetical protein
MWLWREVNATRKSAMDDAFIEAMGEKVSASWLHLLVTRDAAQALTKLNQFDRLGWRAKQVKRAIGAFHDALVRNNLSTRAYEKASATRWVENPTLLAKDVNAFLLAMPVILNPKLDRRVVQLRTTEFVNGCQRTRGPVQVPAHL